MTAFPTCVGCSRVKATCPRLIDIKTRIAGLRVTSLRHQCADIIPRFRPGEPVLVRTAASDENAFDENGDFMWERFEGVFIKQIGSKGLAFIKPGAVGIDCNLPFEPRNNGQGFVKIPLSRIEGRTAAPDGDAAECSHCGEYPGLTGKCQGDPEYLPEPTCRLQQIRPEVA
jgi:hypothetical protein